MVLAYSDKFQYMPPRIYQVETFDVSLNLFNYDLGINKLALLIFSLFETLAMLTNPKRLLASYFSLNNEPLILSKCLKYRQS